MIAVEDIAVSKRHAQEFGLDHEEHAKIYNSLEGCNGIKRLCFIIRAINFV
jgi:hypothetical protein